MKKIISIGWIAAIAATGLFFGDMESGTQVLLSAFLLVGSSALIVGRGYEKRAFLARSAGIMIGTCNPRIFSRTTNVRLESSRVF